MNEAAIARPEKPGKSKQNLINPGLRPYFGPKLGLQRGREIICLGIVFEEDSVALKGSNKRQIDIVQQDVRRDRFFQAGPNCVNRSGGPQHGVDAVEVAPNPLLILPIQAGVVLFETFTFSNDEFPGYNPHAWVGKAADEFR